MKNVKIYGLVIAFIASYGIRDVSAQQEQMYSHDERD